jgi:hypothetical protein
MPGADPVPPPVLSRPVLACAAIGSAFFGNLSVWALPLLGARRGIAEKTGIIIATGASAFCVLVCVAAIVLAIVSLAKRSGGAVLAVAALLLGVAGIGFGGMILVAALLEGRRYL